MLLEMWMIIQFQVTAGAKCNKNRKNEDENSYYSNVRCCSKHVCFLIAPQILKSRKSSSNLWIPPDKNSFPFEGNNPSYHSLSKILESNYCSITKVVPLIFREQTVLPDMSEIRFDQPYLDS